MFQGHQRHTGRGRVRAHALIACGLACVCALVASVPASATVRCRMVASTNKLEVKLPRKGDVGTAVRDNARIRIRRNLTGRRIPCKGPAPRVDNVDEVEVRGAKADAGFVVDLKGGQFRPGKTDTGPGSEIEFDVKLGGRDSVFGAFGGSGPDRFTFGGRNGGGVLGNLFGSPAEPEILLREIEIVQLNGAGGGDVLRATGRAGYPRPLVANGYFSGGSGADVIVGGSGNDFILGQSGGDRAKGKLGEDVLFGGGGGDRLEGGPGTDLLKGQGGLDRLFGGSSGDSLDGGAPRNRGELLDCGPGRDVADRDKRDRLRRCEFKS